jgi:hypothetical protein
MWVSKLKIGVTSIRQAEDNNRTPDNEKQYKKH